jgi:hypothetical protein
VVSRLSLVAAIAAVQLAFAQPPSKAAPKSLGAAEFYRPPQLSVMVGFIKDPQHTGFTVADWKTGIGKKFDARALVARIKASGAATIVWYDKWIDGLVFRKTATTAWQTDRDFLAELAPECHRQGIHLVVYFNTFYDGNPEFEKWAARAPDGKIITYPRPWPAALLSVHSPYRAKVRQQIEELFRNYGIDGLWLDSVQCPAYTSDAWTAAAFAKRYGHDYASAPADLRREFAADSAIEWNKEAAALARSLKPTAVLTFNGLVDPLFVGPRGAVGLARSADYFSTEMPVYHRQREYAHLLGCFDKPYEGLTMLSDEWFTPLDAEEPQTTKTFAELRGELATVLSGGMNLLMSMTLSHDGTVDESTMRLLDDAGVWLRARRAHIAGAESIHDVGIVLGTTDLRHLDWPGGGDYTPTLLKMEEHLRRSGYLPRRLLNNANAQNWDSIPAGIRALIVPDRACLTAADAAKIESFVRAGGRVLSFGRGVGLGQPEGVPKAHTLFGLTVAGYRPPPIWRGMKMEWASTRLPLTEPVLDFRTGDAETLAWATTASEGSLPAITSSHAGAGIAVAVAAAETAVLDNSDALAALWKRALPAPVIRVREVEGRDVAGRFTVRLRRNQSGYVLHVIDGDIAQEFRKGARYKPVYIDVSVDAGLYPFREATLAPEGRRVQPSSRDGWNTIRVFPSPEVTVLLR